MPLLDINNPKIVRSMVEMYEKERRIRMRWLELNNKKIQQCATFKGDVKNYTEESISKALLEAGMATITRDHVVSTRNRLRCPNPKYAYGKTDRFVKSEAIMYPVNDEENATLMESSKEYFKLRGKRAPEDKYRFVECNNWNYGWKLKESELETKGPTYGRICHTIRNTQTRVGPQPDPLYYSSPCTYSHLCFQ